MLVHGANLKAKENHPKKYRDDKSKQYLSEIRVKYDEWHKNNLKLSGPFSKSSPDELHILQTRVSFFEEYKNFLDQQHYAEHFDSRSNLHSIAVLIEL